MYRQYKTYIKTRCNSTIRLYLATCFGGDRPSSGQLRTILRYGKNIFTVTAETCSQIYPNCNYCILFDVCCVMTVHNILYKSDNTQRDGLSQIYIV